MSEMATPLDRAGNFRVSILEYALEKAPETPSHCVLLKCKILEQYNHETKEWEDWRSYDEVEVFARIWVIGKEDNLIDGACTSLVRHCGWDGNFESITEKTWQPTDCQLPVEESTYKGKTTFKGGFVNGWDSVPGGSLGGLKTQDAKALASRFGAPLRALAGSVKQSSTKPAGKPPSPPKAKKEQPVGAVAPNGQAGDRPDDEIPFSPSK